MSTPMTYMLIAAFFFIVLLFAPFDYIVYELRDCALVIGA
jgi:hypothetical protein